MPASVRRMEQNIPFIGSKEGLGWGSADLVYVLPVGQFPLNRKKFNAIQIRPENNNWN